MQEDTKNVEVPMFLRDTYAIETQHGRKTVSGWRYGNSGLGYHEESFPESEGDADASPHGERYVADHLASGYHLPTEWFYTATQVEAFIVRIASSMPWKEELNAILAQPRVERASLVSFLVKTRIDILRAYTRYGPTVVGRALLLISQEIEAREKIPEYRQQLGNAYREEIFAYASLPQQEGE